MAAMGRGTSARTPARRRGRRRRRLGSSLTRVHAPVLPRCGRAQRLCRRRGARSGHRPRAARRPGRSGSRARDLDDSDRDHCVERGEPRAASARRLPRGRPARADRATRRRSGTTPCCSSCGCHRSFSPAVAGGARPRHAHPDIRRRLQSSRLSTPACSAWSFDPLRAGVLPPAALPLSPLLFGPLSLWLRRAGRRRCPSQDDESQRRKTTHAL